MPAKIVVLYPTPKDADEFELAYADDHIPMVTPEAFPGLKKFVQIKVLGTANGSRPPFLRIAELHFDTIGELRIAAVSPGAAKAIQHAAEISTGGKPIVLVCDKVATTFAGGKKAATK